MGYRQKDHENYGHPSPLLNVKIKEESGDVV